MEGSKEDGLARLIAETRERCRDALASESLARVTRATKRIGLKRNDFSSLVHNAYYTAHAHEPLKALKKSLLRLGCPDNDASVERFLLLHTALISLDRVTDLPVAVSVKRLICEEFIALACPIPADIPMLQAGKASFTASCRVATLCRFPAGQIHWEMSGLPRSWLFRPRIAAWPRLWRFVALHLRGFKPAFSSHLAWRRKNRLILSEHEQKRAYYRMAQSLAFQPRVRGLVTDSWFYSPDTYRVSPHLAWLREFFLENGGLVEIIGPAPPGSGYLEGSGSRRRLYERGEFQPTTAVVLWPRAAMLSWAERHPEFGVEADAEPARQAHAGAAAQQQPHEISPFSQTQ